MLIYKMVQLGPAAEMAKLDIRITYQMVPWNMTMCNLCHVKVAKKPLSLKPPLNCAWLHTNKITDSFHL